MMDKLAIEPQRHIMSVITSQATPNPSSDNETIESRFGTVAIDKSKMIMFPRGLLGMPDRFHFCLTEFPTEKMRQFKLLQSLDDPKLSFITLPLDVKNNVIAEADILQACGEVGIGAKEAAVLLIVAVQRGPDAVKVYVNARAPLLVETTQRLAVQHVFPHDKYKVQHLLT